MYLYGDKFLSEVKIHAWRLLSLYTNLSSGARQDDVNAHVGLQELVILSGTCILSLDTYFNLTPINHLYVLFVEISCQAKCLQISYPAILFTLLIWFSNHEFYRSRPSAENKQWVRTVSFLAGHMHSRPSAWHTTLWYPLHDFANRLPYSLEGLVYK